jgi:HEAT repeat protein
MGSTAVENRPRQDSKKDRRQEDERWSNEQETLRRAAALLAKQRAQREVRAMSQLATADGENSLALITESLEDPSKEVRSSAVRALYRVNPEYAASFFNTALREGPTPRRRMLGAALAGSGLVNEAIQHLKSGSRQNVYDTVTLLFLVAKAGEVTPLVSLLEDYPGIELRLALIELLALSGETAIVPTFRRLAVQRSLPPAVRSAVMEAIYQITTQSREVALEE